MADTTPPPAPNPAPTPGKTKGTRNKINQAHLQAVEDAKAIAAAAVDPAHTAGLAAVELDEDLPAEVTAKAIALETEIGAHLATVGGKEGMGQEEQAARDTLLEIIDPIQTALTRIPAGADPAIRTAYSIGVKPALINTKLEGVIVAAKAIHARLIPGAGAAPPKEVLPGITALGKIKALGDAIAAYEAKNEAQGTLKTKAGREVEALMNDVAALSAKARAIQKAAEQAWPYRAKNVKTIRKAFQLPPDRPFAG